MTHAHNVQPGKLTPRSVTWLALVFNAVLSGGKVIVGLLFHSQALLADGVHSASDMVSDVAVLAGLAVSDQPPDAKHQYGHRRVTTLVTLFIGASLLGAAVYMVYRALSDYAAPDVQLRADAPFWVATLTIPVKEVLYHLTHRVGTRFHNRALVANAWHHRTDALTSLLAAAALGAVAFGGERWRFLDPVAAVVLSTFLAAVALKLIRGACDELIDAAPSRRTIQRIEQAITATPGVRSFHALRARHVGGEVEMDVHVLVNPGLTVAEGHDIAAAVRRTIQNDDPRVAEVIVHVEPSEQPWKAGPPG